MTTTELTDEEMVAAAVIRQCLIQHHVGKDNAVTAPKIISGMKVNCDIHLCSATVRRIINWLRNTDQCVGLCSDTAGGYYIAANTQELEECCDKLHNRWINQYETEMSLRRQLDKWRNVSQTEIDLNEQDSQEEQ